MFVTSLSASCNTTRRSKQLHFDPGKMAVMVRSGSAAHPSNCTRLWCSKYPQSTRNIFLGKLKCVAQAHTTGRLTRSNAFCQVQHQCHCSQFFFPCSVFEPLHLQQNFPDCLLSSSISAISSVPINAVLLLPLRHLRCSQSFPPTYQRRHKRNRPLTCDITSESKRTSLCNLAAAIFHFVPPFSSNSTISLLVSFVKSKGILEWKPSHPTPVFSLYNLEAFSKSHSFSLGKASSNFFSSSFS